jgi:glucose/arabinose dehydrogenase
MKTSEKVSRRRFLAGVGLSALGAAGLYAAYHLSSPQVPQTQSPIATTSKVDSQTNTVAFHPETVAENLMIPWSLAFAPDGRMFVTERMGRINVVASDSSKPSLFSDISVEHVGEGGLLGLALSPTFDADRFVYVYHTYRLGAELRNRVVRLEDENGVGTNSRVIIDGIPGASIHDGGRIRFGPDGKLYIGTGDSGDGSLAQNLESLAGKILRVNPDGFIPSDNPFLNSPVYSYGHRNVQGFDWHPLNGRMYETEHGPTGEQGRFANDEVNQIEPGRNYGWPLVICKANDPRYADPVFCTGDNETWAPSGCSFYKPEKESQENVFGDWKYSFFIATLRGEHLHLFSFNSQTGAVEASEKLLQGSFGRLREVVQGPDGLLYILTSNRDGRGSPAPNDDRIIRLQPA